jgi:hypothetical protein
VARVSVLEGVLLVAAGVVFVPVGTSILISGVPTPLLKLFLPR